MKGSVIGAAVFASVTINPVAAKPSEFVAIADIAPSIQKDIRYFGRDNFVGTTIDGYLAPKCLLHQDAAKALAKVQKKALQQGMTLKVFDCYRPQRAVDHFVRWVNDTSAQDTKAHYYPNLDKGVLLGDYIAAKSGHSRGATVDLTLVDMASGEELDMGSAFDMFDPISNTDDPRINAQQRKNRYLLRDLMTAQGFAPYAMEWWHFSLKPQPYPDTYFDFVVR
ncbi:peptidase M15 [Pseudoalteromonas ruthenica]|uniref:D-alanyl-D-alanine dipeptidase n=1 Tax=Pseudoalteromonas ruthenica TaxID=151081 RepID=A0A5S3Z3S4_9GAMM|nr:M15 family metallopeptidase [Pseudoalteromonas ruthenica]TMP86862.1 peptidase M15 [Pseudoalteromonas ruthenica]